MADVPIYEEDGVTAILEEDGVTPLLEEGPQACIWWKVPGG
jgi:hypothetical protein